MKRLNMGLKKEMMKITRGKNPVKKNLFKVNKKNIKKI